MSLQQFVAACLAGEVQSLTGALTPEGTVEGVQTVVLSDPEQIAAEAIAWDLIHPDVPWSDAVAQVEDLVIQEQSVERGGPGSGHFGHEGRPGERGGSAPGGGRAAEPKEFRAAFERAFDGSRYTHHVTHYTDDELGSMRAVLLNEGGTAGVAVKDHGDGRIEATALFNRGGGKGAGLDMLRQAIEQHGVNYVEAFGPYLPKLYEQLGFEVQDQFPFDPEQAPPGWNYEAFGTPDYFTMRLRP